MLHHPGSHAKYKARQTPHNAASGSHHSIDLPLTGERLRERAQKREPAEEDRPPRSSAIGTVSGLVLCLWLLVLLGRTCVVQRGSSTSAEEVITARYRERRQDETTTTATAAKTAGTRCVSARARGGSAWRPAAARMQKQQPKVAAPERSLWLRFAQLIASGNPFAAQLQRVGRLLLTRCCWLRTGACVFWGGGRCLE